MDVGKESKSKSPDLKRILAVPSVATQVHVVILVHGWLGKPLELGYLQQALAEKAACFQKEHPDTYFLVHRAVGIDGRTHDGIAAGGSRLATEVNGILHELLDGEPAAYGQERKVSCSFVGHSLGGLYARYALSEIPLLLGSEEHDATAKDEGNNISSSSSMRRFVQPKVFCTTATPHLGVSKHTYIPLFRAAEYVVGNTMLLTGRDLFRISEMLERMTTEQAFVKPLERFSTRLAYANTFRTDFQVPTSTAAFLVESQVGHDEDANHRRVVLNDNDNSNPFEVLRVATRKCNATAKAEDPVPRRYNDQQLSRILDDMGWTKVFCDVRPTLWSIPVPSFRCKRRKQQHEQQPPPAQFSSSQLLKTYGASSTSSSTRGRGGSRWYAPHGHAMLVANTKNKGCAKHNAPGRPIMDQLASELLQGILVGPLDE